MLSAFIFCRKDNCTDENRNTDYYKKNVSKGREQRGRKSVFIFAKRRFGSTEQLRGVADILLDNALKYSFDETSVWVELIKKERFCVLSVKSIGEHIGKDDLKNIFKRFYRIDEARTDGESYGLGLSIAETIIEEHKGKIWAESKENENVFYVQIPI